MQEKQIEPQVIAFFIQDEQMIVANPCNIPIEMIENAIKEHKKRKDKKLATHVVSILIPLIKLPKKKHNETKTKTS